MFSLHRSESRICAGNQPLKVIEPVKRPQRASALAATKRVTDFAAQQAQSNEVRCLSLRWGCLQGSVEYDLFCFIWIIQYSLPSLLACRKLMTLVVLRALTRVA